MGKPVSGEKAEPNWSESVFIGRRTALPCGTCLAPCTIGRHIRRLSRATGTTFGEAGGGDAARTGSTAARAGSARIAARRRGVDGDPSRLTRSRLTGAILLPRGGRRLRVQTSPESQCWQQQASKKERTHYLPRIATFAQDHIHSAKSAARLEYHSYDPREPPIGLSPGLGRV